MSAYRAGGRGSCCRRPFVTPATQSRSTLSRDICHLEPHSSLFDNFHTLFHLNDGKIYGFWEFVSKYTIVPKTLSGLLKVVQRRASSDRKQEVFSLKLPLCNSFLSTSLFFLSIFPLLLVSCAWRERTGASPAATARYLKLFLQFRCQQVKFRPKDKKKEMKQEREATTMKTMTKDIRRPKNKFQSGARPATRRPPAVWLLYRLWGAPPPHFPLYLLLPLLLPFS